MSAAQSLNSDQADQCMQSCPGKRSTHHVSQQNMGCPMVAIHSSLKGLDVRRLTLKVRAAASGSDVCLEHQGGERKVAGRVGRV